MNLFKKRFNRYIQQACSYWKNTFQITPFPTSSYLLLSKRELRRWASQKKHNWERKQVRESKIYVWRSKRWGMELGHHSPPTPNFPEIPEYKLPLVFPTPNHTHIPYAHLKCEQIQTFHPFHCCSHSLSVLELRTQSIITSIHCQSTAEGKAPDSNKSSEARP